jgi:energy-coupling factor transporter ATP-binding protein EcfA2
MSKQSNNIEAFLKEAVRLALPVPTPPRLTEKENQKRGPATVKSRTNSKYQSYAKGSSNRLRPASRIRKLWKAPVVLHPPNQGQKIKTLKTLQKTVPAFELPIPPTAKLAESKKWHRKRGGVAATRIIVEKQEKDVTENLPSLLLTKSERIGTNYSVQTIGMSPRLSHSNSGKYCKSLIDAKMKKEVDQQWQVLNSSTVQSHEMFLHLDSSKLPLWNFISSKNSENETGPTDNALVEEEDSMQTAQAKLYIDGQWTWRNCEVLSYDPKDSLYIISFIDVPIVKKLRRMHLVFPGDNKAVVEKTVADAVEERNHTKTVLRFMHYVNKQNDSKDLDLPEMLQRRILDKVAFVGRSSIPGNPYYAEKKKRVVESIIFEIGTQYKDSQKKATAIYSLMHPVNDALRFFCRLPSPEQILPAKEMTSFNRARAIRGLRAGESMHANLKRSALFLRDIVYSVISLGTQVWYPHFEEVEMFETDIFTTHSDICLHLTRDQNYPNPVPVSGIEKIHLAEKTQGGNLVTARQHRKSLNHIFRRKPLFQLRSAAIGNIIQFGKFIKIQMLHVDAVVKQLTIMWRNEIVVALQNLHLLRPNFDFYTIKAEQLDRRAFRIIRRLSLEMKDQLSRLIERSFEKWLGFFQHKELSSGELACIRTDFLGKSIEKLANRNKDTVCLPLMLPPPLQPYSFHDQCKKRTCQNLLQFLTPPANGECSLQMIIDMESVEYNFVNFEPSLKEIKGKISDVVRYGFEECRSLEYIDSAVFQFLAEEGKSMLGSNEDKLAKECNKTEEIVDRLLGTQLEAIEIIAKLYREYSEILKINESYFVRRLFIRLGIRKETQAEQNRRKNVGRRVSAVSANGLSEVHRRRKSEQQLELFDPYLGGNGPIDIQSEVRRFAYIRDEVLSKTFDIEHRGMFVIDCSFVKRTIAEKADSIVKHIANALLENSKNSYSELVVRYEALAARLADSPSNEKEIESLRNFLASCPDIVSELKQTHLQVSKRVEGLSEFNVEQTYDSTELQWKLMQWPYTITKICDECSVTIAMLTSRMKKVISRETRVLDDAVKQLRVEANKFRKVGGLERVDLVAGEAASMQGRLENANDKAQELIQRELYLDETPNDFMELGSVMRNFLPFFQLWTSLSDALADIKTWKKSSLWVLDTTDISAKVSKWNEETQSLLHYFQKERIRDPKTVAEFFGQTVTEFLLQLPLITTLRDSALQPRHWVEIAEIIGFAISPDTPLTLDFVISKESIHQIDKMQVVLARATKEMALEVQINEAISLWEDIEVKITFCAEKEGWFVVSDFICVYNEIDDLIIATEKILMSRYINPLKSQADSLMKALAEAESLLRIWELFQSKWKSLHPMFAMEDVRSFIPLEARKFTTLDNAWKRIMSDLRRETSLSNMMSYADIRVQMSKGVDTMEEIFSIKRIYLNTKRAQCPRLYLLDDISMLSLMSSDNHLPFMKAIMRRIFPGVTSFDTIEKELIKTYEDGESESSEDDWLPEDGWKHSTIEIHTLHGHHGETLRLMNDVVCDVQTFPTWTNCLEKEMKKSVAAQLVDLESSIENRAKAKSVQVNVVQDKILWTNLTHDHVLNGTLNMIVRYINDDIRCLVQLLRSNVAHNVQYNIHALLEWKLHSRDTTQYLIDSNVTSESDYSWQTLQRYHLWGGMEDDDAGKEVEKDDSSNAPQKDAVQIHWMNRTISYENEYIGDWSHVVIHPLNDRCHQNLMSIFHSIKDPAFMWGESCAEKESTLSSLASCFGIPTVVIPSSTRTPLQTFVDKLKGISSSGFWGVFQSCEQILPEIVSVLVSYVETITTAKKALGGTYILDGVVPLPLNRRSWFCFTSEARPFSGKKLSDAIAVHYRTLIITVPNWEMVLHTLLATYDFYDNNLLPDQIRSFVAIYNNNFAFESVGRTCMSDFYREIKRYIFDSFDKKLSSNDGKSLVAVIKEYVRKRFLFLLETEESQQALLDLVDKLFKGQDAPKPILEAASPDVDTAYEAHQLVAFQASQFAVKALQSFLTMQKPIIVYGNPGSGKSTIQKLATYKDHSIDRIYPDSLNYEDLVGTYSPKSGSWQHGYIISMLTKADHGIHDKSVLAIDICNQSSFIDTFLKSFELENKLYCVPDGGFVDSQKCLIFETTNVSHLSPTTFASTCMLYVTSPSSLWQGVCRSWLSKQQKRFLFIDKFEQRSIILMEWIIPPLIENLQEHLSATVLHIVDSVLCIFEGLILSARTAHVSNSSNNKDMGKKAKKFQGLDEKFIYAVIWGFAPNLNAAGSQIFEKLVRDLTSGSLSGGFSDGHLATTLLDQGMDSLSLGKGVSISKKLKSQIPNLGSIFDYVFNDDKGKWVPHKMDLEMMASLDVPAGIFVPTKDTARLYTIVEASLLTGKSTLLTGSSANGKSTMMKTLLKLASKPSERPLLTVPFAQSNMTRGNDMFKMVVQRDLRINGRTRCAPKSFLGMTVFIDDIAIGASTNRTTEIVRQALDAHAWFHSSLNLSLHISDISFASTVRSQSNGQALEDGRFARHFLILNSFGVCDDDLLSIITGHVGSSLLVDKRMISSLCHASVDLYRSLQAQTSAHPPSMLSLHSFCSYAAAFSINISESMVNAPKSLWQMWSHQSARAFRDGANDKNFRAKYDKLFFSIAGKYAASTSFEHCFLDPYPMFSNKIDDQTTDCRVVSKQGAYAKCSSLLQDEDDTFVALCVTESCCYNSLRLCHALENTDGTIILQGKKSAETVNVLNLTGKLCNYTIVEPLSVDELVRLHSVDQDKKKIVLIRHLDQTRTKFLSNFLDRCSLLSAALHVVSNDYSKAKDLLENLINNCRVVILTEFGSLKTLHDIYNRCSVFHCICIAESNPIHLDDENEAFAQKIMENKLSDGRFSIVLSAAKIAEAAATGLPTGVTNRKQFFHFFDHFKNITGVREYNIKKSLPNVDMCIDTLDCIQQEFDLSTETMDQLEQSIVLAQDRIKVVVNERAEHEKSLVELDHQLAKINVNKKVFEDKKEELSKTIQTHLDGVIPILQKSQSSLTLITTDEVKALRSIDKPSPQIVLVVEATCILLGVRPQNQSDGGNEVLDYFEVAKRKLFNNAKGFIQKLTDFDKDSITDSELSILVHFLEKKNFTPKAVKRQSALCAILCEWATGLTMFAKVSRLIAPIQQELSEIEHNMKVVVSDASEKQYEKDGLEQSIERLKMDYEENSQNEIQAANDLIRQTENQEKAEIILKTLRSIKAEWVQQRGEINDRIPVAFGDDILSTCFIVYCGNMSAADRYIFLENMKNELTSMHVPYSSNFDLEEALRFEIQGDHYNHLKDDMHTFESALIATFTPETILFVDPLEQGKAVVETIFKSSNQGVDVLSIWTPDYLEKLLAVDDNNNPLLLGDIDSPQRLLEITSFMKRNASKVRKKLFLGTKVHDLKVPQDLEQQINTVRLIADSTVRARVTQIVMNGDEMLKKQRKDSESQLFEAREVIRTAIDTIKGPFACSNTAHVYAATEDIVTAVETMKESQEHLKRAQKQLEKIKLDVAIWDDLTSATLRILKLISFISTVEKSFTCSFEQFFSLIQAALAKVAKQRHTNALVKKAKQHLEALVYSFVYPSLQENNRAPLFFMMRWEATSKKDPLIAKLVDHLVSPAQVEAGSAHSRLCYLERQIPVLFSGAAAVLETEANLCSALVGARDFSNGVESLNYFTNILDEEQHPDLAKSTLTSMRPLVKACLAQCFQDSRYCIMNFLASWAKTIEENSFMKNMNLASMEERISSSSCRNPLMVYQSQSRSAVHEIRLCAMKQKCIRRVRVHSLRKEKKDDLQEIIQFSIDRGMWLVLVDCNSPDEIKEKVCGSSLFGINLSRADPQFRLILLIDEESTGPFSDGLPEELTYRSVTMDNSAYSSLKSRLLHLISSIPPEVYELPTGSAGNPTGEVSMDVKKIFQRSVFVLTYFHATATHSVAERSALSLFCDNDFLFSIQELHAIIVDAKLHSQNAASDVIEVRILNDIYLSKLVNRLDSSIVQEFFKAMFMRCNWQSDKSIVDGEDLSNFPPTGRLDMAINFIEKVPVETQRDSTVYSKISGDGRQSENSAEMFFAMLGKFFWKDQPSTASKPAKNFDRAVLGQAVKTNDAVVFRTFMESGKYVFNLKGVKKPKAFLLGLLHHNTHRLSLDMHNLCFKCTLAHSDDIGSENEYILEGLHLHNASLVNGVLNESKNSTELVRIKVSVVPRTELQCNDSFYSAPIYCRGSVTDESGYLGADVELNTLPSHNARTWSFKRCFLSVLP